MRTQISDAARLEERVVLDAAVERLAELDHLLEADADDCRLGVAAVPAMRQVHA